MPFEGTPAVHSLLRLARCDALQWPEAMPTWAHDSLRRAAWVVVRRASPRGACWPVGVRGELRSQRAAAWVDANAIAECLTPPSLLPRLASRCQSQHSLAALAALPAAAVIFAEHGLADRWGPGGSVGFELASGLPTVTAGSDLDLIVHLDTPNALRDAQRLHRELSALPVRADVLLETPRGGVSLAEYVGAGGEMLLRSAAGPRLVRSPWDRAAP